MELDIPPFEHTYDEHKAFVQDIVNTMRNRLRNKWSIRQPVHEVWQIPFLVEVMTEFLVRTNGILSTAQWECSDRFIDYGYYSLTVEYYKHV